MKKIIILILILSTLLVSACKADISRNDDGSFAMETSISQRELQETISAAIADPLIQDLTVSLQSGYALVFGTRQRLNDANKTDAISFRLNLSVNSGELTASISDAVIDGQPIEQNRVDHWNQTIANRLSNWGGRSENATLQTISISPENVTMTWNVSR